MGSSPSCLQTVSHYVSQYHVTIKVRFITGMDCSRMPTTRLLQSVIHSLNIFVKRITNRLKTWPFHNFVSRWWKGKAILKKHNACKGEQEFDEGTGMHLKIYWPLRGHQVSHQRRIWGFCCAHSTKHASESIHSGFETQGRCPQQGRQWPHKKDWCLLRVWTHQASNGVASIKRLMQVYGDAWKWGGGPFPSGKASGTLYKCNI